MKQFETLGDAAAALPSLLERYPERVRPDDTSPTIQSVTLTPMPVQPYTWLVRIVGRVPQENGWIEAVTDYDGSEE